METSPFICSGLYLIGTSVMKELIVVNDRFNMVVAPTEVICK